MDNATKRAYALLGVIAAFFAGFVILILSFFNHGSSWATNKANQHLYSDGSISTFGDIYDCNGVPLAQTVDGERKYNEDQTVRKATLHAVGDLNGFISTGVQYTYRDTLAGYDRINGIASIVQYGKGNDVYLTIDSAACKTAYNALNGRKGAVIAYNYKTGKIACLVSSSSYDPENKPLDIDKNSAYEGVYLNRAISGLYTPGSTMKVITAASAVENIPGIDSLEFDCDGEYETGDGKVICNDTHGKVNFSQALNRSCNSSFTEIALKLGRSKLTDTATELGFNTQINVNGIANPNKSVFNVKNTTKTDLGWAAIGQYTTLVSPYHMMCIMGCIANNGTVTLPYLVDYTKTPGGKETYTKAQVTESISLPSDVAGKLNEMMRSNVTDYYGDWRFPNLRMCGKTGTAENDKGQPHSWFVGYSQNSTTPYAIAVVVENSGTGLEAAGVVANSVMQSLIR